MSEIKKHFSPQEIALLIIGTGPELKSMQALVKKFNLEKYIFIKGKVTNLELMQYYKAASLFVLPSISEGMPTVILEAFYFNLPVIASDIPNIRNSVKDMAILVPPKNENKLAAAIRDAFYEMNLMIHKNLIIRNISNYIIPGKLFQSTMKKYIES